MSVINPVISQVIRPVTQPPTKPPKGGKSGGNKAAFIRDFQASSDDGLTSHTAYMPETAQSGDVLVMVVAHTGALTGNTTLSTPSGWTKQDSINESTVSVDEIIAVYTKTATGSDTSETITSGVTAQWSTVVYAVANCDSSDPIDFINLQSDTTASASRTLSGTATSSRKTVTIGVACNRLGPNPDTVSSPWVKTYRRNYAAGEPHDAVHVYENITTGETDDLTITWDSSSGRKVYGWIALKASGREKPADLWIYADLATAEASSDAWDNEDIIHLLNGVPMRYFSALASRAHSGLLHLYPNNDYGVAITSPTLVSDVGPEDPDTWSGWQDNPIAGTKGVNYDYGVSGGRVVFEDLGVGTSQFNFETTTTTAAAYETSFCVFENITITSSTNGTPYAQTSVYVDASNVTFTRATRSGSNWSLFTSAGAQSTTVTTATERRLWIYICDGKASYWFDDMDAPTVNGTANPLAASGLSLVNLEDGAGGAGGGTDEIKFEYIVTGHFD